MEEIMSIFWKKKIYIIVITILITIIGMICSYNFIAEEYKSSTTLMLGRVNSSSDSNSQTEDTNQIGQSEIKIDSSLVSTYSKIIKSDTLINKLKNNLKLDINEKDLKNAITVRRVWNTQLIEITVINQDKDLASKMANETAKLFSEKIKEIYNLGNVYIIDVATPNVEVYNINHIMGSAISFAIGIIISIIYVFICSKIDKRVKNNSDIEDDIGLKLLISMPSRKRGKSKSELEIIGSKESKSPAQVAFDTLRTNIQFSNINKENKVMLITSCFSSEGKSYIAANLAVAFAESGKKVILIDADMNRGKQARIFNLPDNLGFSNYLSSLDRNGMEINERVNKFINETGIRNLNIITSGSIPPNSSELLTSNRLPELIKELNIFYDLIIFDGAPVLPAPDSLILSRLANSTMLVSLYNRTKKDELYRAKKDIQNVGGTVIGVVLNKSYIDNNKLKNILKNETDSDKNKNAKKEPKQKFSKIKLNIKNIKNKFLEGIKNIKERKSSKPKLLEKGIYEEDTYIKMSVEEKEEYLQEVIAPLITYNDETEELDNISLFVDDILESTYKENETKLQGNFDNNEQYIYDNFSEDDKKKLEEIERIEKEKRKLLKKEQSDKSKKERKEKIENQKNKILEEIKTRYNSYKIKKEEKLKVKQKEDLDNEKILEEKKVIEKEEKAKLSRIKEEEKIRNREIKKLEKEKSNKEKEEKKQSKDLKRQKQKEEARIKEEIMEDNLYPKTKYNKNLF